MEGLALRARGDRGDARDLGRGRSSCPLALGRLSQLRRRRLLLRRGRVEGGARTTSVLYSRRSLSSVELRTTVDTYRFNLLSRCARKLKTLLSGPLRSARCTSNKSVLV